MKLLCNFFCFLLPLLAKAQHEELPVPGQNLFVNKIAAAQTQFPNLVGSGITVSIKEFRFDSTDVDFRGRVLASPNAATNLTTHANIVASLVGGAGTSSLAGRGAAPGCQLVSSSFVGLMPDADYAGQNISVQNHSYGVDIQNWYGAGAIAYDQTTTENPRLVHVFSAGNKGDSTAQSGQYANTPGFANLTGNFKMAKNILLVGATDSLGRVLTLSSRGPAYDGRTKPDLVAFGQDGTSGAAALVSGAAAVVQQTLREQSDTLPYSDLVRAILINSADDIAAPGPGFESGFGNLNLKNAVKTALLQQFATAKIAEGQTIPFPLNVPANVRQFKITLAWNDPVAALSAPRALLHDLDLRVLDPLGKEYFPWVLNTFPHPDSLRLPARAGRDSLNNTEQVTLEFPSPGLWEIHVSAPQFFAGNQDFAVAWNWDTLNHFEWTYPLQNDPAPAARDVLLRWETNLTNPFASLEWRTTQSTDWQLIEDSVNLQSGWQRWVLPDTFAETQLKMTAGNWVFFSDTFLISKELRMQVGFNCPDSVLLFWNAAHPSANYVLFGLGAEQLEWVSDLSDTFVVLQKNLFPQPHFAIAPRAQGASLGARSPAPNISTQGVECYFKNFFAELNPDFQVDLTLQIGTTYGLSNIFFEKIEAGAFVKIGEQVADSVAFVFVDENPQAGENTYRARLLLENGATLSSDPVKVYFAGANNWRLFPNPVKAEDALQVVATTEEEASIFIFDVLGKLILEKTLENSHVEIPLNGLPRGVYFFKINNGFTFVGGGKLMVE